METDITIDEMFDAMMTLRSNKTPGGDGLTLELYRKIWPKIKYALFNNYKSALSNGQLNPSARKGVINLLPKKVRNKLHVRNWRPIVLQNVDCKIWAKVIANRLEECTHLIGPQQNGFIKGRSIFTNILSTLDVVTYLNKNKKKKGIIVTIDFEKCFDKIEHKSIEGVFKYFGFGDGFV